MVVTTGFALTVVPEVVLKPVGGDHVYVTEPDAVKLAGTEAPGQIPPGKSDDTETKPGKIFIVNVVIVAH